MIENKTARDLAIGLAMVEVCKRQINDLRVCKRQINDVREPADEANGIDDLEWPDNIGFAARIVHSCLSHEIYHALLEALVQTIGYAEGES